MRPDVWRGEIVRDDNEPAIAFVIPFDVTGSTFRLVIDLPGGDVAKSTDDPDSGLTLDVEGRTVLWTYTAAESRAFPEGVACRFKLQRLVLGEGGERRTYLAGTITANGGLVDVG